MNKHRLFIILFSAIALVPSFAASSSVMEVQTALVIQIGIILFVVKLGGMLAQKLRMPSVLGELISGMIIGPFALGGIGIPGFPTGLFAVGALGPEMPISPELYSIATIASIILLFMSGLETDIGMFLKYSVAGSIVGIGGVLVSFIAGDLVGVIAFGGSFMDPRNLFLGIMSTATSVGITARILSDRKKMDSPEGVTILAAAVFDDVLGIVFLAVVMGIAAIGEAHGGGAINWGRIGLIALRAFGLWLGFTALGLVLAKRIARFLKRFKHITAVSILALGLALILAGFFEKEGLAMIIGAYIIGLSLSKTDISHLIIDKLHVLYEFFVPIFFAVMGMLVDIRQFLSPSVLIAGLVFTVVAVLAKVIGCGLPALFVGFNPKGALRIGTGMVPRGEVALIIAGIGMSGGILSSDIFGMAIMMTLLTTVLAPFGLNAALKIKGRGTRKDQEKGEAKSAVFNFPSEEVALLVTDTMTHQLQSENFYVRTMDMDENLAQVRKDDLAFSMQLDGSTLNVNAAEQNMPVVMTTVFEAVATLNSSFEKLKNDFNPASFTSLANSVKADDNHRLAGSQSSAFRESCIVLDLKPSSKEEAIQTLVKTLADAGALGDPKLVLADVLERERSMSTGMQHGVALPHAKTDGVSTMTAAVGIVKDGMEYGSLDGEKTHIIVLSLSPKKNPGPHLQFLASVGALLRDNDRRKAILAAKSPAQVMELLAQQIKA